jgi:hypothetical protein
MKSLLANVQVEIAIDRPKAVYALCLAADKKRDTFVSKVLLMTVVG